MKRLPASLFSMALMSCGLLFAGCEKQADKVAPVTAAPLKADASGTTYNNISGVEGQVYSQGPGATGLSCYISMRLIKVTQTGNGETSIWETDADSPAPCPPARQLSFHNTFEYQGLIYDVNTNTDTNGNVRMVEKFSAKNQ